MWCHSPQHSVTASAAALQSCPTLCDPIDGSQPGILSLAFSRQEQWSGLPFPSPMQESEKWKWSCSVVSNSGDPMDCSLPDSSAHGIFQARVLEWGAIAFSKYYFKNTSKQNRPQIWLSGSVATAISLYRVHKESVRCETWTIKGTKGPRIDAFELWCWRRLFRAPWTEWRSNQLILKETNPEYSLEELLLKLKLRYFGHLMWRANTLEKTLMLRKS